MEYGKNYEERYLNESSSIEDLLNSLILFNRLIDEGESEVENTKEREEAEQEALHFFQDDLLGKISAMTDLDPATRKELDDISRSVEEEIRKYDEEHPSCTKRDDEPEEKGKGGPIVIDGKPAEIRKAPKWTTTSTAFADKVESRKNSVNYGCFIPYMDTEGKEGFVAYPFGNEDKEPWTDGLEGIHVNRDELVIESRIRTAQVPDGVKESMKRTIRMKLPDVSDLSSVKARISENGHLMVTVSRKPDEGPLKYDVCIIR